jgi:hypothetical protein
MYLAGASLGPIGTGLLSDTFTARAASAAGVVQSTATALEPYRGDGLHAAMHIIPLLAGVLAVVLYAATRTVGKDIETLETWTRAQR